MSRPSELKRAERPDARSMGAVVGPPSGGGDGGSGGNGNGDGGGGNGDNGDDTGDRNLIGGLIPPLQDTSPEGILRYTQDNPAIVGGGLIGTALLIRTLRGSSRERSSTGSTIVAPLTSPYGRAQRQRGDN